MNNTSTLRLVCNASAVPPPKIVWLKNGVPLEENPGTTEKSISYVMAFIKNLFVVVFTVFVTGLTY